MFRKIYTGPLMYKMLVDELSESLRSQGIFTEERLETMMDKIEEIESKQFKNFSLRDYEGFERDPFKFTSRFLAQEIIKRKNDFETRPLHHKQLTKILGELLEKENKCTLLSVMVKYNYKVKDIPARELVMALENYKDPFNVTQENLLYLLNIGKNFDGIWERIEEVCDCLYLDQVVSLFQSMNSIHSYLGKKHSYEEPMDPIVKKMFGDRRSNKKKVKNGNLEEGKKEDKIEESVENLNQDKENLQESDDVIDVNELELKKKLDNFEEYLKFSGFNEDSSEDVEENIINEQNIEEMDNKIEQNKDDLLKTEGKSNKSKKGSKKKKENIEQTEDVTSNSEEGISKTKKSPDSIDLKLAPILESDTPTNQELIEKNEDIIQESELNKAESALKSKNFSMPNFIKLNNFKVNPNPKPKKSKPKEPKKFVFGDKNIKMYPDNPGKNIKEDFNRDINPKDTNRIPEHYIEKLLSRFLDLVDESNFQKICKVLDCSRELFPHKLTENMKKLQIALIEYPIFPDDFKPSEIASIVKNFPESGIKLNEDLVKSFGQKVEKIFPDLWHTDKIEVFQGLHRAGLKIPQKIVNSLEELDIEVLESLNSDKVLGFYQDLADSEVLTENLSQTIVES